MIPTITETKISSIPFLSGHSVQEYNGLGYTFSGRRWDSQKPNWARQQCYKFNPDTGTLIDTYSLPYMASHSDVKLLGNHAISVGGMSASGAGFVWLDRVQAMNLDIGAVVHSQLLPQGGYDIDCLKLDDQNIFFYGGHGQSGSVSVPMFQCGIIHWDGASLSIQTAELLNRRVYATAHLVSSDEIIILGGIDYATTTHVRNSRLIEIFNICDMESQPLGALNQPRRYHVSELIDGKVYVFGGSNLQAMGRGVGLSSVECVDVATGSVDEMQPLLRPRYHAQSCVVTDGADKHVMLVGGQSTDGVPETDIELYNVATGSSEIIGTTKPFADHNRISWTDGNIFRAFAGEDVSIPRGTNYVTNIAFDVGVTCSKT